MATIFDEGKSEHTVKESIAEVTDQVNQALKSDIKHVTFTREVDDKQISVVAQNVSGIREA